MKSGTCSMLRAQVFCLLVLATTLSPAGGIALAEDGFEIDARQIQGETVTVLQTLEANTQGSGQKIIPGAQTILPTAGNALRISWKSLEAVKIRDAAYASLEFGLDRALDLVGLGGLKKTKVLLKAVKHALTSSTPEEFAEKLGEDAVDQLGDKLGISGNKRKMLKKLYKTIRDTVIPKIREAGTTTHYEHPSCGPVSIAIWGGGDPARALSFRVSTSGDCKCGYSGRNNVELGAFSVYGEMPAELEITETEEPKLLIRISGAADFYVEAPHPCKQEEETAENEPDEPEQPSYVPPIGERICLKRCNVARGEARLRDLQWAKSRNTLMAAETKFVEAREALKKAEAALERQETALKRAKDDVRELEASLANSRQQLSEKQRRYDQLGSVNSAEKFNLGVEIIALEKQIASIEKEKLPAARKDVRRLAEIVEGDERRLANLNQDVAATAREAKKLLPGFALVSDANKDGQAGYGICMRNCLAQDPKGPWVKLEKTKLRPGAKISASYKSLWGHRISDVTGEAIGSWIGIAPADEPELTGAVADKVMVGKKRYFVPERHVDDAVLKMELAAPDVDGDYEVRLYSGTEPVESFLAAKARFTVNTATRLKARYKDLPPKTLEVR